MYHFRTTLGWGFPETATHIYIYIYIYIYIVFEKNITELSESTRLWEQIRNLNCKTQYGTVWIFLFFFCVLFCVLLFYSFFLYRGFRIKGVVGGGRWFTGWFLNQSSPNFNARPFYVEQIRKKNIYCQKQILFFVKKTHLWEATCLTPKLENTNVPI